MSRTKSLIRLTAFGILQAGATCLSGTPIPASLALGGATPTLVEMLKNALAGNTANALDKLTEFPDDQLASLQNQDLTRAIGKAIGLVIDLVAEEKEYRSHLKES